MRQHLWLAGLLVLLLLPARAGAAGNSLAFLEGIQAFSNSEELRIVVRFRHLPPSISPAASQAVFHGNSVSLLLPQVAVSPERRTFSLQDRQVEGVEATQVAPAAAELRFLLSKGERLSPRDLIINRRGEEIVFHFHRPPAGTGAGVTGTRESSSGPGAGPLPQEDALVRSVVSGKGAPMTVVKASTRAAAASASPLVPAVLTEAAPVRAASTSPSPVASSFSPGLGEAPSMNSVVLRMVASLAAVLGVLLLCAVGGRRFLFRKGGLKGKQRLIRVLSSSYLGPKKSLSLVEVDGERLVLGVSQNQISMLARISEGSSVARDPRGDGAAAAPDWRPIFPPSDEDSLARVAQSIQDRVSRLRKVQSR